MEKKLKKKRRVNEESSAIVWHSHIIANEIHSTPRTPGNFRKSRNMHCSAVCLLVLPPEKRIAYATQSSKPKG